MTLNISERCRHEHCLPALVGETKEEVVTELVGTFVDSGALDAARAPKLLNQILGREEEGTTGIGKGVAMPHARASDVVDETLIGVGLHPEGVDFDATDGAPVHVIFLIASADPDEYLRVAGRIARVARDDVEMNALQRQTSAKAVHKFLEESWSTLNA